MIGAVVLAGGASTRMGRPKAALPLGPHGHTVLSAGLATLLDAGLPRIVVVAGAHPAEVAGAIGTRDARVTVVEHPGWAAGQLSSILRGLDALEQPTLEAALITLVDVPLVSVATVRALIRAWRQTRAPIVRPARGGEHGHPVIFDRPLFAELRAADPALGAKPVVRSYASRIVNLTVEDDGAFMDVDTVEDYQRALAWVRQGEGKGERR